jgi:hypothetical protein
MDGAVVGVVEVAIFADNADFAPEPSIAPAGGSS